MASSFQAKDSLVLDRQLKVQELVIPFSIVGNSTSVSVSLSSDEPGIMFLQSQGVDQITGAVVSGETVTYSNSADDGLGVYNILIKVKEKLAKVCDARIYRRSSTLTDQNTLQKVDLGSSTGISVVTADSTAGTCIMLTGVSSVALNASNTLNACLRVSYIVAEGN